MRRIGIVFTLLFLSALPRFAAADMIWSDAYKSPMSSWGAYMYDQNVKRHMRNGVSRQSGSSSSTTTASTSSAAPAAPAVPSAPISATDFVRSPNGKDVVAAFIGATNLSPADGQTLANGLRSTMAQLGGAGRKDNVATAMTLLIGLSYGVLEKPGFDANKADDMIPIVNNALAASPQFTSLSAVDRQNMYDSLLLSTAVIAMLHQSGDKATTQNIARQTLQQMLGPGDY